MRQVPANDASPIGIVGNGRVARHFRHYFGLLGIPFQTWSRQESPTISPSPPNALAACAVVLLLIRDDAIVPFIEAWPALQQKRIVHCSGSLVTRLAAGAHPLMTFGPALYDMAEYRSIPFVIDRSDTSLADLLPGLPNPWFAISPTERPYYHALCVMAGNFSVILWSKLFDELEQRFGIPRSAAFPYLERVTANLVTDASRALTGPLSRGDRQAIADHLKALEGDPFHAVYAAFVRAYEQRP
jgi:predicted short-subunit dehydrogenase-like oxidoreductase (DUF2520 family)